MRSKQVDVSVIEHFRVRITNLNTTCAGASRYDLVCASATACLVAIVLVLLDEHRYMTLAIPAVLFAVFAIVRPRAASLSLLPLGLLISIAFEWGFSGDLDASQATAAVVTACVAIVTAGVSMRWLSGQFRLCVDHLLIGGLGALVMASYLAPSVVMPSWMNANSLVDSHHFPGLLVCLLMLAITLAVRPKPAHILQLFVWSSVAVAVFAFSRGLYGGNNRLYTEVYYSTWLGIIEGPAVVVCIGLAYVRRTPLWLAPAAICLACVIASGSRAGMLAAVVGVTFFLMTGRTGFLRVLYMLVLGLGAVMILRYGGSAEDLLAPLRAGSSIDSSDMHRTGLMTSSLQLIAQHPLRGVGYGNLVDMIDISYGPRTGAHNDYIRLAAENGLPALVLFLVLVFRGVRSRQQGDLGVIRALVVSCLVWIGTDVALPHPVISVHFWIPLACLLAARVERGRADAVARSGAPA
ncbi:O-antigen ligase family protein [Nonomuraea sediminis]|uniref:O-antigen ligase family protein n=1 Tax=Nonomuraea sediminis TaxID=2835864 RepID=UPI001BDC904D|nr:O-antigen ligase family protein [Nonomuraea sediminis]